MSNDLIKQIQNQVLALPDGGVDEDTRAVAGNVFGKRLSIRGGVFRKYEGNKEVAAIEDRHLNVIFVKLSHTPSRNFYPKAYVEGENASPTCWSSDTKAPDTSVKEPQSKLCVDCPQSIKGSSSDGNGTACRLSWRTAVVLPQDPGGDVLQLVLPATSVFGKEEAGRWPFRSYIQMLAGNNISAGRVITKMSFDTKSSTPRVLFQPVSAVPGDALEVIKEQGNSDAAHRAVELKVYERKETPQAAAALAPAATKPTFPEALKALDTLMGNKVITSDNDTIPEPILRKSEKQSVTPDTDLSAIISKWSKKA